MKLGCQTGPKSLWSSLLNTLSSDFNVARPIHHSDNIHMSSSLGSLTLRPVQAQPDTLSASEDERLNAAGAKH